MKYSSIKSQIKALGVNDYIQKVGDFSVRNLLDRATSIAQGYSPEDSGKKEYSTRFWKLEDRVSALKNIQNEVYKHIKQNAVSEEDRYNISEAVSVLHNAISSSSGMIKHLEKQEKSAYSSRVSQTYDRFQKRNKTLTNIISDYKVIEPEVLSPECNDNQESSIALYPQKNIEPKSRFSYIADIGRSAWKKAGIAAAAAGLLITTGMYALIGTTLVTAPGCATILGTPDVPKPKQESVTKDHYNPASTLNETKPNSKITSDPELNPEFKIEIIDGKPYRLVPIDPETLEPKKEATDLEVVVNIPTNTPTSPAESIASDESSLKGEQETKIDASQPKPSVTKEDTYDPNKAKKDYKSADDAKVAADSDKNFYDGMRLNIGGRYSEIEKSGKGTFFIPLVGNDSNLLFTELGGFSGNTGGVIGGLGFRHDFDDSFILGANGFYETTHIGGGAELLSKWIDLNANYYSAIEDAELIDVSETSTHIINRYRVPMTGFEGDLSILVPLINKFDTRLRAGYADFKGDYGDDLKGVKYGLGIASKNGLEFDAFAVVAENKESDIDNSFYGIQLSIPLGKAHARSGIGSRMFTPVRRDLSSLVKEQDFYYNKGSGADDDHDGGNGGGDGGDDGIKETGPNIPPVEDPDGPGIPPVVPPTTQPTPPEETGPDIPPVTEPNR